MAFGKSGRRDLHLHSLASPPNPDFPWGSQDRGNAGFFVAFGEGWRLAGIGAPIGGGFGGGNKVSKAKDVGIKSDLGYSRSISNPP